MAFHRAVEAAALGTFAVLWGLLASRLQSGWEALVAVPAAWLAADLLGGLVHYVADNFGSPATPYFGPAFIRPFREHHDDPTGITRHGFLERHGNNALVTLPVLVAVWLWPMGAFVDAFALVLCLAVAATNQVHCWAHMERPPAWVRGLQAARLILPRARHARHHTAPHDSHYCILMGVAEPLLNLVVRAAEIVTPGNTRVTQGNIR